MADWAVTEYVIQPAGEEKPLAGLTPDERETLADLYLQAWAKVIMPDGFRLSVKRRRQTRHRGQ